MNLGNWIFLIWLGVLIVVFLCLVFLPYFYSSSHPFTLKLERGETLTPGNYKLVQDPVVNPETNEELGVNDEVEIEELKLELQRAIGTQQDSERKLKTVETWYKEFEELSEWMFQQDMWGDVDINEERPMTTYKNGLVRFLKSHNIPIK